MGFDSWRLLIGAIVAVAIILFFISKTFKSKNVIDTKFIVKTGIFSAISIILYCVPFLKFSLPFFPSFLEIHFDEVPALIAGFAYGPICGSAVILIKTIVKLPLTTSAGVGELADLIYSLAFVISSSLIYKKMHNIKGALLSLLIGSVVQIIVASTLTTFVMLDIYAVLYPGLTKEVILILCQAINPLVTDLTWPFLLMVSAPFNAMKDAFVLILTLLLYKRLHLLIDKIGQKKTRN